MVTKPEIVDALGTARRRTLGLLDPVPPVDQARQVSPLMSPLCWDLAHIGHYEELWLIRELTDAEPSDALYDDIYDAFKHPRHERDTLPILDPSGARAFDADVRKRALDVLDGIALEPRMPLLADGFVYGMVVQHEHQHDETLLATLQLMDDFAHPDAHGRTATRAATDSRRLARDVLVDGGTFTMGTSADPWAYDNERPAHIATVEPFRIDTTPVSNRAYLEFIDDGGYDDARHWTNDGWAWRQEGTLLAPQFWHHESDSTWSRHRFGRHEDLPLDEPVQHVCWYEADAFARWSGARLPTEAEWERAVDGADPAHANLWPDGGTHRFAPDEIGSHPDGVSRWGVHQLFGDVWEWTASGFTGHPGFRSFPYREYSEVFFGPDYKVLRGGSWATHPSAMRTTFRNWDYPRRRQIFAGFRSARDA